MKRVLTEKVSNGLHQASSNRQAEWIGMDTTRNAAGAAHKTHAKSLAEEGRGFSPSIVVGVKLEVVGARRKYSDTVSVMVYLTVWYYGC